MDLNLNAELKSPPVIEELNRLVYEYLELNGMERTLSSFATECKSKSLPSPKPKSEIETKRIFSRRDAANLLKCYSSGDLDGFVQIWKAFLTHIQLNGEDLQKLEVYIRVHFAVWPRVVGESEVAQVKAMQALKQFFEAGTSTLSADKTILPLLALPFVAHPVTHPTFCELYEPAWSQRLKVQLETTLSKYFELVQENIAEHSILAKIVLNTQVGEDGKTKSGITEIVAKYHQERFLQLMTTYRKVRRLLRGTRESYGKLLKVSNALISGLESSVSGETTALEPIIEICFSIFPELFTPDVVLNARPDKEYFKKLAGAAIFDSVLDSDVSLFFIGISDLSPDSLDYGKIKSQLTEGGSPSEKLCLLQAIRWLLTRSTPTCREYAMESFIQSDLLGIISSSSDYRDKLFACMLSPAPTYFKECFARLLNSMASMKTGRTYLASTTFTLEILVESLGSCKGQKEAYICHMVVATLQKLSLRKKIRLAMIELDVIQCLVIYLKSEVVKKGIVENEQKDTAEPTYNPYLMEYGWALLMNLCLHEESKGATASIASDILTCIIQMLHSSPPRDVSPYVISTLYSLLRSPEIYSMAKRIRLQETLVEIIAKDLHDRTNSNPLNQLIDILSLNGFDRLTSAGEINYDDDDDNDPDEFEPELEVPEGWLGTLELCDQTGDDLLIRHYLVQRVDVVLPNAPPPEVYQTEVHLRPTTPSKSTHLSRTTKTTGNESAQSRTKVKRNNSCRNRKNRDSAPSNDSSLLSEGETQKSEPVSNKKMGEHVNIQSQMDPHTPNSNPNGHTVTLPVRNDPNSSYHITNVLPQKQDSTALGASDALKRKLRSKNSRSGSNLNRLEPSASKTAQAAGSMCNVVNGEYDNFDDAMYYDDIFASVSNSVPQTEVKPKSSRTRKNKIAQHTVKVEHETPAGAAAGEPKE